MTLKFSRNTKVTRALTGRRPVRPVADDNIEKVEAFCFQRYRMRPVS